MKIEKWDGHDCQWFKDGDRHWSVAKLIQLAKDLPVMEIPLDHLYTCYRHSFESLQKMATHINAVMQCDLKYPIILDENGLIMDGRHRVMKAMIQGKKTVKAVRFERTTQPCKYEE